MKKITMILLFAVLFVSCDQEEVMPQQELQSMEITQTEKTQWVVPPKFDYPNVLTYLRDGLKPRFRNIKVAANGHSGNQQNNGNCAINIVFLAEGFLPPAADGGADAAEFEAAATSVRDAIQATSFYATHGSKFNFWIPGQSPSIPYTPTNDTVGGITFVNPLSIPSLPSDTPQTQPAYQRQTFWGSYWNHNDLWYWGAIEDQFRAGIDAALPAWLPASVQNPNDYIHVLVIANEDQYLNDGGESLLRQTTGWQYNNTSVSVISKDFLNQSGNPIFSWDVELFGTMLLGQSIGGLTFEFYDLDIFNIKNINRDPDFNSATSLLSSNVSDVDLGGWFPIGPSGYWREADCSILNLPGCGYPYYTDFTTFQTNLINTRISAVTSCP